MELAVPNTFGHLFRVTTFGESHGGGVGVVVDGCPPGHQIDLSKVQNWLNRRRPGQSRLTSPRTEADQVECLSGLEKSVTLGTPICLLVRNQDAKKDHYDDMTKIYRPSHADFTTDAKYGLRPGSGGGRASARETIGRVAAAAIAEQLMATLAPNLRVVAWVDSVHDVDANIANPEKITREQVEEHPLRCPDKKNRNKMEECILSVKKEGDSVGGTIRCVVTGTPVGLGDPVFDKLEADLAKGLMSLPATKAFEVGMGFASTRLKGSQHNDPFTTTKEKKGTRIRTSTNNSGGIQGGISNGEPLLMRVAFKPVATIFKEQETVDESGRKKSFKPQAGRHDPCVLPRAVPMVEAMVILVLMDHLLRQSALSANRGPKSRQSFF